VEAIKCYALNAIKKKRLTNSINKKTEKKDLEITNIWLILTLSIATSIDALMIGVSFAFLKQYYT
jgi:putative Mn2+ efflux pump MntP